MVPVVASGGHNWAFRCDAPIEATSRHMPNLPWTKVRRDGHGVNQRTFDWAIFNSYVCLPEGICHIYIYISIVNIYIYICLKIIEDYRTSLKIPRLFSVRKVRGFVCFLFDFVWMRRYSCWNIAKMRKVHIFRVKNEFFFDQRLLLMPFGF